MTPGYYRLEIYRGDTTRWQFVLWRDDAKTIPVDLAGVAVSAQLRDHPNGKVYATLGCTITAPNKVNATLATADAAQVVNGAWDLQLTYGSGDVVTALAGDVWVVPDVTR